MGDWRGSGMGAAGRADSMGLWDFRTIRARRPEIPILLNSNVVYSDRSEKLKKKLAFFSKHQQ
jgi:hypothetical protein